MYKVIRNKLRYILFHHQTTTKHFVQYAASRCVISSFITKPQLHAYVLGFRSVALYPLSSPNHNWVMLILRVVVLRYILFHHQTTTLWIMLSHKITLRYILFHHQTTTYDWSYDVRCCCVISSFITKPQPVAEMVTDLDVALYPLSSPNHNCVRALALMALVALYPLSSPNHNTGTGMPSKRTVALYPLSSPNHNQYKQRIQLLGVALYPLSSPNHNIVQSVAV